MKYRGLFFGLLILLVPLMAHGTIIVNNSGTTSEDSICVPVICLDSMGKPATADSFFVLVVKQGNDAQPQFSDSGTRAMTGIDTVRFGGQYTAYFYHRAISDIDGTTPTTGVYSLWIYAKINAQAAWVTPNRYTFQIVERELSDALYATSDSTLRPTVISRTLDVTTTGEAGVDLSNVNGTLDAAEIGSGALTAPKFASGALDTMTIGQVKTLNAGAITKGSFASAAMDTLTVGKVTTTTTATNVTNLSAGSITKGSFASAAMDTLTVGKVTTVATVTNGVNATQISGTATAADALEDIFDGDASTNRTMRLTHLLVDSGVQIVSKGANPAALYVYGQTAPAFYMLADTNTAFKVTGKTGMAVIGTGSDAAAFTSAAAGFNGMSITGNTTGEGLNIQGGASGAGLIVYAGASADSPGVRISGGGTAGAGAIVSGGATSGIGMLFDGGGSAYDISAASTDLVISAAGSVTNANVSSINAGTIDSADFSANGRTSLGWAVWQQPYNSSFTDGTMGDSANNNGFYSPTSAVIADAVWDEDSVGHYATTKMAYHASQTGSSTGADSGVVSRLIGRKVLGIASGAATDTTTVGQRYAALRQFVVDSCATTAELVDSVWLADSTQAGYMTAPAMAEAAASSASTTIDSVRAVGTVGAFAANAITGTALDATAGAEIADAVWDEDSVGHYATNKMAYHASQTGAAGSTDSGLVARIVRRVAWGLPAGSGSDSTTAAQRVTAESDSVRAALADSSMRVKIWRAQYANHSGTTTWFGNLLKVAGDSANTWPTVSDIANATEDSVKSGNNNAWTAASRTLTALDEDNTTMDLNATAVGSVAGAVGSVTGAVGSVTGAVGSVTGAVGSVTGLTNATIADAVWDEDSVGHYATNKMAYHASQTGAAGSTDSGLVARIVRRVGWGLPAGSGSDSTTAAQRVGGSLTGNVGGSVASVTGAVGSVTGAVGSVTGLTNATISDAVWDEDSTGHYSTTKMAYHASQTGATASTDSGLVARIVRRVGWGLPAGSGNDSTTAAQRVGGSLTGNVGGSVASVSGSVGSVTGSVGSVTGSVGSVTGLTTATISDAVWDEDSTGHYSTTKMAYHASQSGGTASIDSAQLGRIVKRAGWGIPQGSGSDSSTIAQRTVTATASVDSAQISRLVKRTVWGIPIGSGSDSSTAAQRVVSASVSCAGSGPYTFAIMARDTGAAPDSVLPTVTVSVNNLSQSAQPWNSVTLNTGYAYFNLDTGTYVMYTHEPGLAFELDTFTVTGSGFDTLRLTRGNAGRTNVAMQFSAASGVPYDYCRINIDLRSKKDSLLSIGDTIVISNNNRQVAATADEYGLANIPLYPNASFTSDSTWYYISVQDRRNGKMIDRFSFRVPSSDTTVYLHKLTRW